jgi:TorA maturation chaperone TorD
MTKYERVILCHLLAQSFSYPNIYLADSLKRLVGNLCIESWDSDSQGQPLLPIAPFIRVLATLDQRQIELLQQEHMRLFGGDRSPGLCPPYAWAYRPDVSAETLAENAQRIYAAWGWDVVWDRATHLETELEFLAFLYRQTDNEAAQLVRENFFSQHALIWLLRFAADVVIAAQFEFYRTAAQLLTAFVTMETFAQIGAVGFGFRHSS